MGIIQDVTRKTIAWYVSKGRKKMKTIISYGPTNFQQYTESVNDADELVLTGLDGNGQAFGVAIYAAAPGVLAYNPTTKSFAFFKDFSEMSEQWQVHKVIRAIV